MSILETIRVSVTCSRCGALNELTAAHLHETTVIHCSRCSASIGPLGSLARRPVVDSEPQAAHV
jgi:DNA-directed RNA polymerase subunit RPC12/RpoP